MVGASFQQLADHAFEAVGALSVALLVFALRRRHHKPYLDAWLRSSLAGFLSAGAAALAVVASVADGFSGYRFPATFATIVAAWFEAAWLLVACRELARLRSLTLTQTKHLSIAVVALGSLHALVLLGATTSAYPILQEGVLDLALAAAAAAGAWWIFRQRFEGGSTPFALFSVSLLLYASLQVVRFVVMVDGSGEAAAMRFGIADLVLRGALALGIVISLLEDEREAAVAAAEQVEHIAYHDLLTGLPNRALFFDRLIVAMAHAHRYQTHRLALLFFDLDRFKNVNDSLGHTMGDALLKSVADRIRGCLRRDDTLARFGGDEFVILTQINDVEDAGKVAQKTLAALNSPFAIANRDIVITSSIGIAVYPNDGSDAETLVKNADTAMYRAKEQGRDNYQFYTSSMNARALEMLEIESDLRMAVVRNELQLHYQPLIDVEQDRVFGLEALLRWQHPERGLLLPEKFIATAEGSGLIIPIGNWVLHEACRQAKSWQRQFACDLIVCVNLSARQFQQPDLADQVRSALGESGLRAKNLELEITESNAMKDVDATIRILRELKAVGVRIAIDDFGTGYSSLSYLRQFPVDTLKLDQSFVREITVPEDGAIASGVIAMAHSLRLKVLAEGVETLGQLEFLKANACDRLQGYLFSRPLTPPMFEKFVTHNKRHIHVA